jgi:hypothetical protein
MDFIRNDKDPFCESFFENFEELWSRPSQSQGFRAYVLGLLGGLNRKNIDQISRHVVGEAYQSLHHFLTAAPWDAQQFNDRRIELLEQDRRTRSRPEGVLILDDSGVPKKGTATEGVARQYLGELGKVANGQVFVTSHYADERCHWPVDLAAYVPRSCLERGREDPDFHTKIDLALGLLDKARQRGVRFRAVVADNWYGSNTAFLGALEQRTQGYVAQLRPSMRVFARLPGEIARNEHRLCEVLCLLTPENFRPVAIRNADGTERQVHVAALAVKLKGLPHKRRVIVATHRPDDPAADKDLRFLTTNVAPLRNDTVVRLFALRNWIEVFYRESKDDLGAGQYQVRDLDSILRHWQLVFVGYSLLQRLRRQGKLARCCHKELRTVRQTLAAFRDYLEQQWLRWLPDHLEVFKEHLDAKRYSFALAELTK